MLQVLFETLDNECKAESGVVYPSKRVIPITIFSALSPKPLYKVAALRPVLWAVFMLSQMRLGDTVGTLCVLTLFTCFHGE